MYPICCFSARPLPTIADLISAGVYEQAASSLHPRTERITPLLSARASDDFGLIPENEDSTAAQSGVRLATISDMSL